VNVETLRVAVRQLVSACLLVLCGGLAGPALAGPRVALVLGNAAYSDAPLRNPLNDAQDLAAKLRGLGFDVTVATNRNRSQMTAAIRDFGLRAAGADAALFYFAGHGVQVRGRNFLLPVGQPFADEAEVETDAVDVNSVLAGMEEAGAKVSLLILDACRTSPLKRRGRSSARGLARMDAPSGALIAFAAQPGAEAQDGDGRNGVFTKHLLAHIEAQGMPVEQMFKRVRADVERETGRRQSPREESSLTAEFHFASPFAPLTPDNRGAVEDAAWALCQNGATRLPCDDYLSGWPQGRYAALARTRIRDLAAAARPVTQTQPAQAAPDQPSGGQRFTVNGVGFEMRAIPAGSFLMGSPSDEPDRASDEGPQRRVSVRAFQMGKTEVTQGLWQAVMGSNASGFSNCGANRPVEHVSWNDVQSFIQRLNQQTGRRFRLPSEAEWEYAARAECETPFTVGEQCRSRIEVSEANFDGNYTYNGSSKGEYRNRTTPVTSFKANGWGLYDMHGNVGDWVQDCYGPYSAAPSDGSAKEESNCGRHVLRGGGWGHFPRGLRSACRSWDTPGDRGHYTGFRLARTDF
jgi:formylglycine-generating enzyme required for sulfatase activity